MNSCSGRGVQPKAGRVRVAFLIPTLKGGGAERVFLTLLRHIDRAKFECTLVVVDLQGATLLDEMPRDVELIDLKAKRVRYALLGIVRTIRRLQPDIVLSTLGHLNLAVALLRPLLPTHMRFIGRETCVVSAQHSMYAVPVLWRVLYRWLCPRFDHVVCQSQDMAEDLWSNYGVPISQASVIHNPLDAERIRELSTVEIGEAASGPAKVSFVAAGRLSHQKGIDLLIEAFGLLNRPDIELTILGEGPLEAELKGLASRMGVSKQITFMGFRKNPYPFLATASAFIQSSRFEGFPNVVLEALACGTPVIACPAPGGTAEILSSREDCEIASEISAAALAEAMKRWLAGPRARVPEDAVQPYAADTITKQYEHLFARIGRKVLSA